VLVLSQFTGASRELKDAVIVNPYDIEEMADAISLRSGWNPRNGPGGCGGCARTSANTTFSGGRED